MPTPALTRRVTSVAVVSLAVASCLPAIAAGAQAASPATPKADAPKPVVRFTHQGCGPVDATCRRSYNLALEDGEKFAILVERTLPNDFTYDVEGIPAASTDKAVPESPDYRDTTLVQLHDKRYGGYIVNIRRKAKAAALPEATLIIGVRTAEWTVAVAGGFPASTLTDRQYSLQESTVNGEVQYVVRREKDHEDKVALSTATFVHLRRTGWRWPYTRADVGLSFGLGVSSNTTYFLGPSLLFGNAGALTVGAVMGSRADLPNGVNVNAVTSNANALTNPARRNGFGWFAGFSYSFLGNTSALEKPFKGAETPEGDTTKAAKGKGGKGATPGEDTGEGGDANAVAVKDGDFAAGDSITFSIRLVKGDGGTEDLMTADYQVRPLAGADSALVAIPTKVHLTAVGDRAEGSFKGKLLKAPAGAAIRILLNSGGYHDTLVTRPLASR